MKVISSSLKTRPRRRAWALSLLLAAIVLRAAAGQGVEPSLSRFTFRLWNTSDGLPQNVITAMHQTPDGYLWVGTQGGLARFDGVSFTVFDPSTEPAFADRFITALAGDLDGALWVGTRQGLIRYRDGAFQRLTQADGLPLDYVRSLWVENSERVWIGTYGGGLALWEKGNIRPMPLWEGSEEAFVRALFQDSENRFWVGTSKGLMMVQDGHARRFGEEDGLRSLFIRAVAEGPPGTVWVGTENGGLHVVRDGKLEPVWPETPRTVRALHAGRDGGLWVGSQASGLLRLTEGKRAWLTEAEGLPHNSVWCLLEDGEGSLFLGTRVGLVQIKRGRVRTLTAREGLDHESVRSILQGRDGRIWAGTEESGLQGFSDGRFFSPRLGPLVARAEIRSMFEDRSGALWLGTRLGVLRVADNQVTRPGVQDGLSKQGINAFEEDSDGAIWIGTAASGVWRYFQGSVTVLGEQEGLSSNLVRVLLRARDGRLWVGTEDGLNRVGPEGVQVFTTKDGLSDDLVFALHEDRDGRLWVGTSGGLSVMSDREGLIDCSRLAIRDNPFDETIFRILEDDRGTLWMSTQRGVLRVDRRRLLQTAREGGKLEWERLNELDGMATSECNGGTQPAGWRMNDGTLWFPSVLGIAVIDPHDADPSRQPPGAIVESVQAEERFFPIQSKVRVPVGIQSLQINYTAPSFQTPDRIVFRYRLDGFDRDWVAAGKRRSAFYTNLGPGDYLFRVSASADGTVWSAREAVAHLYLEPAWHQTKVFRVLAAFLMVGLVIGLYGLRVQVLKNRRGELEKLVHRRTLDLQTANRALRELAAVDGLTRLANHRSFQSRLQAEWRRAARGARPLSLILIDIDFFKKFNDTYGHLAGDRCLKAVAHALKQLVRREGELLARFGGEEFVALLPDVGLEEATQLAENARLEIEALGIQHAASSISSVVTVSAGVACQVPTPDRHPDLLFDAADRAMYQAKAEGRNRVAVQEGGLASRPTDR